MGKLWVLLPCYNEEKALPLLLDQLGGLAGTLFREQGIRLAAAVINDGSSDGTHEVAAKAASSTLLPGLELTLLSHKVNKGLGAALKTGFSYVLENADVDDLAVTMDADGTHPVHTILLMIEAALQGADVVVASRFVAGGREIGVSKRRRFLSRLCSCLLGFLLPLKGVRDYSCGFRLYKVGILIRAVERYGSNYFTESGFACQAELLLNLCRIKAQCAEVPLVLRYDLKQGASKLRFRQTIWRYVALVTRELINLRRGKAKVDKYRGIS